MSREYSLYLQEHRANVIKGYKWLSENLPEITEVAPDAEFNIVFTHDCSKDRDGEYYAYDAYFYGGNRSYEVVADFKYAWLLHIHNNPHHWQYWILHNDEPGEGVEILDMPYDYILEMICDWWAFSWKDGNLTEIFSWYDKHKDNMLLSYQTRKTVEDILAKMKDKIGSGEDE